MGAGSGKKEHRRKDSQGLNSCALAPFDPCRYPPARPAAPWLATLPR